jgi:ribonuclease D
VETLYTRLRQWRSEKARELNLPVFFILANAHLAGVASALPTTIEELAVCKGMGPRKTELFGSEVLALVVGALSDGLEPGVALAPPPPSVAESAPRELSEKALLEIAAAMRKELAARLVRRLGGRYTAGQVEEALKRLGGTG